MRLDSTGLRSKKPGLLALAMTCALASMQAQAIGMGSIEVKSKLNEPFVAEIPLNIDYNGELDDLVVHLASPEEFERVGLERPHEVSANLMFTVTRDAHGRPIVRVTTPTRMSDPYVSFLLEAEWGQGKMVREYTALLDPPHTVSVPGTTISAATVASTPLPAPTVAPPVVAPLPTPAPPTPPTPAPPPAAAQTTVATPPPAPMSVTPITEEPAPVAVAPQPEPLAPPPSITPEPQQAPEPPPPVAEAPPSPAPEPTGTTTGGVTVASGQTLSAIAGQVRSPDVSLNRMMIALQRANPEAFVGNNINRLKAGAILRIPQASEAQAVTPDEANALVHEQVESWRQGAPTPQLQPEEAGVNGSAKQTLTAAAATSSHDRSAASKAAQASGNAAGAAVTSTANGARPRGAHLEILPPAGNAAGHSQSGSSEGGSGSELRAQIAQQKEELAARTAEITDLKAHVADLEKMQGDSQKLMNMKDSQMAALQQRLAELEKKDADAAKAAASAPAPASSAAVSTASDANAGAVPAVASGTASSATASPAEAASTAAAPVAPKPPTLAQKAPPAPPQEPETPWFMQPFVLIGGALILFAGLLGLMLKRPGKPEPPARRRSFDAGAPAPIQAIVRPSGPWFEPNPEEPNATAPVERVSAARPLAPAAPPEPIPVPAPAPAPAPPLPPVSPPAPAQVQNATAVRPATQPAPVPTGAWSVAARLDAARACMNKGDADGARSMLEAALIEGNAAQQESAFKLLDELEG